MRRMVAMAAKYDGRCRACGCEIRAGDAIEWTRETGARHTVCPGEPTRRETMSHNHILGYVSGKRECACGRRTGIWPDGEGGYACTDCC